MTDAIGTIDTTIGVAEAPSADLGTSVVRQLRTVGYCAGCGTWDEHGAACLSCGYDFTGSDPLV